MNPAIHAIPLPDDRLLASRFGRNYGLNADWWCSAYLIVGGRPNRQPGIYLTDTEDGHFNFVHRTFGDEDCLRVVASYDSLPAALAALDRVRSLYTSILASMRAPSADHVRLALEHARHLASRSTDLDTLLLAAIAEFTTTP